MSLVPGTTKALVPALGGPGISGSDEDATLLLPDRLADARVDASGRAADLHRPVDATHRQGLFTFHNGLVVVNLDPVSVRILKVDLFHTIDTDGRSLGGAWPVGEVDAVPVKVCDKIVD